MLHCQTGHPERLIGGLPSCVEALAQDTLQARGEAWSTHPVQCDARYTLLTAVLDGTTLPCQDHGQEQYQPFHWYLPLGC